jgi:hypothetical protein
MLRVVIVQIEKDREVQYLFKYQSPQKSSPQCTGEEKGFRRKKLKFASKNSFKTAKYIFIHADVWK